MSQFGEVDGLKLFKKQRWLTLKKAAEFLSRLCEVKVDLSDFLKFALEGDVKISLHLNLMPARPCQILDAEYTDNDNHKRSGEIYWLRFEDKYISAQEDWNDVCLLEDGVYDLIMAGGVPLQLNEILSKESRLDNPMQSEGIRGEDLLASPGVFVESFNGQVYELLRLAPFTIDHVDGTEEIISLNSNGKEYRSLMSLPLYDNSLVVRTSELLNLMEISSVPEVGKEDKSAKNMKEDSLNPSEKASLLKMVLGMAKGRPYEYDEEAHRNDATTKIADAVTRAGMKIETDTVRKWLKEAVKYKNSQKQD